MMNSFVEFLSLLLLGLATGVSFSHLLQRGPKATLSGAQFLAVQQVLLRNYGAAIGALEVAALLSTLALAVLTWREPVKSFLAMLACGCLVLMRGRMWRTSYWRNLRTRAIFVRSCLYATDTGLLNDSLAAILFAEL